MVQQTQVISTSQRLWNDAYDGLENDNETAKLVKAYVKTLTMALEAENAPETSNPRSQRCFNRTERPDQAADTN
jgi:hypothetical protein